MKKSIIKEAIEAELERKSLNEGPIKQAMSAVARSSMVDPIARGAGAVGNMFAGIAGQARLGAVNKQLNRTADRIQGDWGKSSQVIAQKAEKMAKSGNPKVQQAGQGVLQNKLSIDKDINDAVTKMKQISKSGADRGDAGQGNMSDLERSIAPKQISDEYGNQYTEYGVDRWLKRLGIDAQGAGKTLKNHLSKLFLDLVSKNINPLTMPIDKQIPIVNYAKSLHTQLQHGTITPVQFDKKLSKVISQYVGKGKMPEELSNEEGLKSVSGSGKKEKMLKQAEKMLFKKLKSGEIDPEKFQSQMNKLKEIMAQFKGTADVSQPSSTAAPAAAATPASSGPSNIPPGTQDLMVQSLMKELERQAAEQNFAPSPEQKENILNKIRVAVANASKKVKKGDIKGAAKTARQELQSIGSSIPFAPQSWLQDEPTASPGPAPAQASTASPAPSATSPEETFGQKYARTSAAAAATKKVPPGKAPAKPVAPIGSPQYMKPPSAPPASQTQPGGQPIPPVGLELPPEEVGPPHDLSSFMEPQLGKFRSGGAELPAPGKASKIDPALMMPQSLKKKRPVPSGPLPVEDNGEEVQVGTEDKPGFGPGANPPKDPEKKSKEKSKSKSK